MDPVGDVDVSVYKHINKEIKMLKIFSLYTSMIWYFYLLQLLHNYIIIFITMFHFSGSIGLKYYALGDLVIILTFGPISVLYAYLVQCHHLSVSPLLYAIPLVMNTEAILHSNNTRDIKADLQANVLTLAIMLGFKLSYLLYCVLVFIPYLIMLIFVMHISVLFILPMLTIKMALNLEKDFRFKRLTFIAQNTAKLNLLFGLLYVVAFALS